MYPLLLLRQDIDKCVCVVVCVICACMCRLMRRTLSFDDKCTSRDLSRVGSPTWSCAAVRWWAISVAYDLCAYDLAWFNISARLGGPIHLSAPVCLMM